MRILLMADMEGVSGIVTWQQVNGSPDPMYQEAAGCTQRRSMP